MILTQEGITPLIVPSSPDHALCQACGSVTRKVRQRKNMPSPIVAPNPYDVPVQISTAAKHLLAQGKNQVDQAKAKAKRLAFAERAAQWSPSRIHEELDKIDEAVKAQEHKIAECLRQRMILEDQLAQSLGPVALSEVSANEPTPVPMTPGVITPDPNACPF